MNPYRAAVSPVDDQRGHRNEKSFQPHHCTLTHPQPESSSPAPGACAATVDLNSQRMKLGTAAATTSVYMMQPADT
jgi:hypothetical protein